MQEYRELFFIYIISGTPSRTGNNKLSQSADSIDNALAALYAEQQKQYQQQQILQQQQQQRQKISKSILKKADTSSNEYNNDRDGDTEKLILDNASASSVFNEGFNQSPVMMNLNAARYAKPGQMLRSNNNVEPFNTAGQKDGKNVLKGIFGGTNEGTYSKISMLQISIPINLLSSKSRFFSSVYSLICLCIIKNRAVVAFKIISTVNNFLCKLSTIFYRSCLEIVRDIKGNCHYSRPFSFHSF